MHLDWVKCTGNTHCRFSDLSLDLVNIDGIYIIWYQGHSGRAVYVGQGNVAGRIAAHRTDKNITSYNSNGKLLVSFAYVEPRYKDGVENYLANELNPMVSEAHPDAEPIQIINLPW